MRARLALLMGVLMAGVLALPASTGTRRSAGPEKPRDAYTARRNVLFRGKPTTYWSGRIKQGDFSFSGWGGLFIRGEPPGDFLNPGQPSSEEILPLLFDLLRDEDPHVCAVAVRGLVTLGHRRADVAAAVLEAMRDEAAVVRQAATNHLVDYRGSRWEADAVSALTKALADPDEDVRWYAALSLRRWPGLRPGLQWLADRVYRRGRG